MLLLGSVEGLAVAAPAVALTRPGVGVRGGEKDPVAQAERLGERVVDTVLWAEAVEVGVGLGEAAAEGVGLASVTVAVGVTLGEALTE